MVHGNEYHLEVSINVQIVLDCRDSVQLARWWAETLDWKFEWLDRALFEKLKAGGFCSDADVVIIDGNLSWRTGAAINSGEESNPRQRMYFQDVPEQKTVKNRMHVDVHVGEQVVEETVTRLETRGATRIGEGSQGPHNWVVMTDPEGNEFCVS